MGVSAFDLTEEIGRAGWRATVRSIPNIGAIVCSWELEPGDPRPPLYAGHAEVTYGFRLTDHDIAEAAVHNANIAIREAGFDPITGRFRAEPLTPPATSITA